MDVERASAAQRRRGRRLRAASRHERQSIAMALAESQHHISRGQKKARAGEEESEMKYTAKFRTTPPPQPELFSLEEEHSWTCVFTAPVAELIVVSFTVPLNGYIIVATATVVTWYSSSADCPGSVAPMCCGGVCVAMSCGGGGFTRDGAYDFVWDSVRPMTGNTLSIISSIKRTLGVFAC